MRFFLIAIFTKFDDFSGIPGGILNLLENYGRERLVRPIYSAWKAMGK